MNNPEPLIYQHGKIITERGRNIALVFDREYGPVLAASTHLELACKGALGWFEKELAELNEFNAHACEPMADYLDGMRQMVATLRWALEPQVEIKAGLREQDTAR